MPEFLKTFTKNDFCFSCILSHLERPSLFSKKGENWKSYVNSNVMILFLRYSIDFFFFDGTVDEPRASSMCSTTDHIQPVFLF